MPAPAPRFTGGTAGQRQAGPPGPVGERLAKEFVTVPAEAVDRCVEDVWACAAHLGLDVTAAAVERIAREHLIAMATSAPLR